MPSPPASPLSHVHGEPGQQATHNTRRPFTGCITTSWFRARRPRVAADGVAVPEVADRLVQAGHYGVADLHPEERLEVLLTGKAKLDLVNLTVPPRTTNTPNVEGLRVGAVGRAARLPPRRPGRHCVGRTMSAMIGTATTPTRVSATISAVADRSGRRIALVSSSVITTWKSMAACARPPPA
jgi:hypothetical protein